MENPSAPQHYDPKEAEPRLRRFWEEEKVYSFDPDSSREIFSIDTPPPTVSGKMHIGHSFSYSQQDFIARFQRMQGKNVFYPFGTDDNGLPTERLVEKMKNVKGQFMKRGDFVALCLKTLEAIRPDFVEDWKRIGISADFNIFYTTINAHSQRISQRSFVELYSQNRIYKKKAPIMFCPTCMTAIAQVEMKDMERESNLVYIRATVEGSGEELVFATTRPELIFGCVGISVHPEDKRYKHLLGGQVRIPLIGRSVELIADEMTDPEYGSGVVYYCTYGGVDCIEWMQRHPHVVARDIMGTDGRYNEHAGFIKGMKSPEARKAVIEALEKEGALVKLEKIKHTVNAHERCDTDIEYVSTDQWYVNYLDLKDEFLGQGRNITWHPEHMRSRFENWIHGLKWDWNISRQRHFGVPIPVWYCASCGSIKVAEESQLPVDPLTDKPLGACNCASSEFIGEKDVLDTWATSSLTPQIATELFKGTPAYDKLFPMTLRPQAHDIITFWLFNTVVKSHMHHAIAPWKNVMISGWALDPHGKKMSKSKGNVVAPQDVISKYSADALRYWAAGSRLGDDMPYQEKDIVTGQKFVTKLWNASKFTAPNLIDYSKTPAHLELMDKWVLTKLSRIIADSTESFHSYEYAKTKLEVDKFFWHTFCDNYLEIVKDRVYNHAVRGEDAKKSAQFGLSISLISILKLMAPITPFITEEVYLRYFKELEGAPSVHLSSWPTLSMVDSEAEKAGDFFVEVLNFVRKEKSSRKLSLKAPVTKLEIAGPITAAQFKEMEGDLKASTGSLEVIFQTDTNINIKASL